MSLKQTEQLWVGEVAGRALVFDPALQLKGSHHLFLWDPAAGEVDRYVASILRPQIKPHRDSVLSSAIIKAYEDWRRDHGSAWLSEESRRLASQLKKDAKRAALDAKRLAQEAEKRALAEAEIIARHEETLSRLGKPPSEVRRLAAEEKTPRNARCYSCKEALDETVDLICTSCSWILCTCGACGCGFERRY